MEKKSFPPPKLKRNKSKAPWAFPLAERKINPPPCAQIKLAWKVHCPLSKWTWTVHSPHQIQLEKKTSPLTSHHPHPGRKLQCQTFNRGMVCSWQPRSFQGVHSNGRSDRFKGSFILLSVWLQGRLHSSGFRGSFIVPLLYVIIIIIMSCVPGPASVCQL
jgi:hypothetical protein